MAAGRRERTCWIRPFPSGWQAPSTSGDQGMAISQFNFEGINAAPLILQARADSVVFLVNSGDCPASGGCPYYSGTEAYASRNMPGPAPYYAIPKGQLNLGVWHELVIHVHLALDSTGQVEVWHRLKGASTWDKTVDKSGFPTLQTGTTFYGTGVTAANISTLQDDDKFGAYRGPTSYPVSIYQDNWCRATSFSAAASCLAP